jgi:hypothetical protein
MNIIEHILEHGREDGFEPKPVADACDHYPGTAGKLDALSRRVQEGQELFDDEDRNSHILKDIYSDGDF